MPKAGQLSLEGDERLKWTNEEHNHMVSLKQKGLMWQQISEEMTMKFGKQFTRESCRGRWRQNRHLISDVPAYKETVEIKPDGSHHSDKLIEMSLEDSKDPDFLLEAHGYDKDEWELITARSNIWHTYSVADGKTPSYASKITVKPKKNGFNFERLLESVKEVPTYTIEPTPIESDTYLNIPLADMHFMIADYDYYKTTQSRIVELIQKGHKEILFILGNDLFHHNDHRNRTASGREIQHGDIIQAWEDAKLFYYPLLEYALQHSEKVTVMYIKGNHSETLEWAFVQMLKERFKQIHFDDEFKERKVHMLGLNYIGATHGDKKRMQNLSENFAVEFPNEWSKAKTRTVYTGHLHHERVIDKGGLILRQLPSGIKADQWHEEMGYTTAHKRFQVHEFTYEEEKCIHYV